MRSFPIAFAMLLATGLSIGAQTGIRGIAVSEDPVAKLKRQVAELQDRLAKVEKVEAAINRRLDKTDVEDDGSGDDSKKAPGKSKAGAPDKSSGGGSTDSRPTSGSGSGSGDLKDVPGKSSGGSNAGNGNGGGNSSSALTRVVAPFVVVDKTGKEILRVQDPAVGSGQGGGERGLYVFDEHGQTVAQLVNSHGGGKLKVQMPASNNYVATAANNDAIGSVVKQDGKQRAFMGLSGNGGLMAIYRGNGDLPSAAMQLALNNSGLVAVFRGDTAISYLTESDSPGGGNVTATDPAGKGVFSAGYDGSQGAACIGHKGQLHCLGIGLPLSGGN